MIIYMYSFLYDNALQLFKITKSKALPLGKFSQLFRVKFSSAKAVVQSKKTSFKKECETRRVGRAMKGVLGVEWIISSAPL